MAFAILKVSGEGGGYTIEAERAEDAWAFRSRTNSMFGDAPREPGPWCSSLKSALESINAGWRRLTPEFVHSDFAAAVWVEVAQRHQTREEALQQWRDACGMDNSTTADADGQADHARAMATFEPLTEFRERLAKKWLPDVCAQYGHTDEGFVQESVVVSARDAADFIRSIDEGIVVDAGDGSFRAPRSHAKEMIIWHGAKESRPRRLSLWLEPIITMGALGRLHLEFGWPKHLLGMQSRLWEFDLVAYRHEDDSDEWIAGEVKKTQAECEALLRHMQDFCAGRLSEADVPEQGPVRNAFKKYLGLSRRACHYFWVVGPDRLSRVFRVARPAPGRIELLEASIEALRYPVGHA